MQNLETTTAEKLPTKKRKRRNSNHNKNNNDEDDGHNNSNNHNDIPTTTHHATLSPKKAAAAEEREEGGRPEKILTTRPGVDWKNLDFILSLQSKEINLQRKVELAFDFVNSDAHNRTCNYYNPQCESVQSSRLIPFLNDWIQSLLISPDKKIPIKGKDIDPCLDSRCWVVFKFCLEQSSSALSFSPNLLRAVSRVIKDASSIEEQQLFGLVSDCFFLLFSSHGLSFNANVDVWASASAAALDLVHKIFSDSFNLSGCNVGVFLRLSYSVLEPFANFLRVHPSPKNVFPVVVDRLLEPLLTMLVLLDHSSNGSKGDSAGGFLKVGEDILLNGLFHSAHIDGFLCIRSSEKYVKSEVLIKGAKESKAVVKSYHKHLFHKLEQFVAEKKMLVLGGLGQLLLLFVSRVKKQKGTMSSVGTEATSKAGVLGRSESVDKQSTSEISVRKQSLVLEEALSSSRMDEATSNSVFDVFVQFMEPLVFDVKRSSGRWSKVGDCSESVLFGAQRTLKSVNKILSSFMHEKLYVRTEDTSEGANHNFLKEVYDTIIAFSTEMHVHWLSALKKDDGRCTEMLLWIAKEVIVAVGYFLEIEYEVIGNDLVGLWHMMLSYLAIDLSLVDAQHVIQEVLHLGCQLVNVYSELRQVNNPIFALCKAARLLIYPTDDGEMDYSRFAPSTPCLSPETRVKAVATLLCSQEFRLAISTAIKSIPEGQARGCIRQLKTDITESLEWMKISCSITVGKEPAETNRSSSGVLDLSLRAELLGKGLSELYTLILDSSTVTTGNSILVGKSIKDLMATIQVSLSSLVQNQSDNLNEFVFAITGRRLSTQKMPECETHSMMAECHISFVFVFFFRIYMSCRSLYRQSISLMPPDLSKRASAAMGDLFTAYSGKDWIERTDWVDGGYFSWIIKPSTSLIAIIQSISDIFLQDNFSGYGPLVYTLHAMACQRLVDLNRQIKAFEFLQERHARVAQIQLLDDAGLRVSRKGIKKWGKHILNSKQEAADLTSFITGYLALMFTKKQSTSVNGDSIGMSEATLGTCEDDAWDFGVSSVNEKSLPTAIWWLLCQNTDVWCPHATKKNLKKFLSLLFYHCLSSVSSFGSRGEPNKEEPGCLRKVTPHYISLELLGDTALYEETFLCRNLTSRFCRILKKSFSPLFFLSSSSDVDFNSLPDWSEVLSMLEKASAVGSTNDTKPHSDGCLMMELDPLPPNRLTLEITACQSLLNILCWMPQGYTNSQSFVVYATYILNIERLVVTSLLSCQGELFAGSHYEFFKLFVSCRRALRYLAMASDEGKLEDRQSSLTEILFGSTFSALWLLKSVSEVVGLLHSFSGEEHCRQVKDMIFSLMDHTSNIFLTLNEGQMSVAIQSQAYKQSLSEELPIQNQGNEQDNVIAADLDSNSSERFNAWKCLELVAETLKEQARSLLDTKFIGGINASNWNKLSSLISCFQGFLWGIASALNEADEAKGHSPKWSLGNVSEFILCINVFEDFVNVCLNTLLVDESSASESLCASCRLPDIDCMNKALSLQATSRTTVKSSGGEDEISPGKQPDMGMADGMDDHSASDAENENATNSGIKFTRTFSSNKQRLKSVLTKCAVNVLSEAHKIDLFELQHLNRPFLRILLKGEHPEVAFSLGQLFTTSSAILRLKHLISSPKVLKLQIDCNKCVSTSMVILIGTSHFVLSEFAEMVGRPHPFSLVWLGGIIKYLEVLGSYFPLTNPVLTRNVYSKLIDVHLRAIGRCISLQGKSATLASHEIESSTKTLQAQEGSSDNCAPSLGHRHYSINEFKARLRLSFKMFIRKPLELHLLSAVQALERALVGAQEGCNMMYGIHTGGIDGGEVSSMVAAGIDCLDLVLESVSGHRRLNIVKRHIQSLISALFNIVLHLQSPLIFSQGELNHNKGETNPDSGSVVLMCVEVLTKVAGRNSLFQMAPYHVGQALHLPTTLFRHFCQLTASPDRSHSMVFNAKEEVRHVTGMHLNIVDRQFSIDLYAACCKLLYTILRHQKR
ncbi:uncharacterized protein LOC131243479 isoform X2 [Magnolia sinica]|uniref:uncharacterized protein LOC131243479 isoform X2 n=1 Tax=Magnolia sinica TaxID=86752 RepID=UPI00265923BD|nr:uncharacterized protein LOC131243479 isoform X2 [Magnolia sinica]